MSAIGPQFYEYIKKLDENNGKLPTSITSRPFQPEFEFNNSTCYICNGYYGPGFGEPVCMTCHEFLYPDIPHQMPDSYRYSEKTDDGDSGNDEPSELMYNDRRFNRVIQQQGVQYHWSFRFRNTDDPEDLPCRASYSEYNIGNTNSSSNGGPSSSPFVGASGGPSSGSSGGPNGPYGGPNRVPSDPNRVPSDPNSGPSGGPNGGSSGGPNGDPRSGPSGGPIGDPRSGPSGGPIGDPRSGPSGGPNGDPRIGSSGGPYGDPGSGPSGSPYSDPYVGPGPSHDDGLGPAVPDDDQPRPVFSSLVRSLVALSTPRLPDNLAPGMVERLPSEVLLCMFSYLDDLSLCACALVCARWFRLVQAHVTQSRWATSVARRWPLLQPRIFINDWHKKYQALVESCFCRNCVVQMCVQTQPPFEENAWRRNRLRNEIKMLRSPPEGCAAMPLDPKCCHWQATVTGPVGSPYEGGVFFLYIQVPYTYPMTPPVVRFLTRIFHPNVSRHGDVGIDSVHNNWSLAITIGKLLISIQSLLTDPYTAVCMETDVGNMYVNDRVRFERIARRWTWQYAMHDMYS